MILTHAPFAVLELRFEAELEAPLKLPPFPGGLLRGAYGASLRALSCMTGFRSCEGCPLRNSCPYPALFEPPGQDLSIVGMSRQHEGIPPPFVLIMPQHDVGSDGRLTFGMRLFGTAGTRLAYVIEAWRRALERGLGSERVRGRLMRVLTKAGNEIWAGEEIEQPSVVLPVLHSVGETTTISSVTPIRLQSGGKPLPLALADGPHLLGAIIRRARLLAVHSDEETKLKVKAWPVSEWLDAARHIESRAQIVWRDWHRFSARQRQRMNLGGYVGTWHLGAIAAPLQPLVKLGELTHIGKDASFGLGAYKSLD